MDRVKLLVVEDDDAIRTQLKYALREEFILEKIRAGSSILGVYPPDEKTLAEFEGGMEGRRN